MLKILDGILNESGIEEIMCLRSYGVIWMLEMLKNLDGILNESGIDKIICHQSYGVIRNVGNVKDSGWHFERK